jgi:hypothetical protein
MGHSWTGIAAAPVGDSNGYLTSVAMKNGDYTLDATTPTFGCRHVTCTRTRDAAGGSEDTPGTLAIVGKDLSGQTITETLTPGASTIVVTSTKLFASLVTATGAAWARNAGAGSEDTLEIGWDNVNVVATGGGTLHAVVINTAAAGAIVIADAHGTIATIPSNQAAGSFFLYDLDYSGYLRVEPAAASNITVMHSGSSPSTYAM